MKLLKSKVTKMISKWTVVFACTLFVFSESTLVDTLQKCDIEDIPCQKDLIKNTLQDISKVGSKEHNIPPIDPIELKNIRASILGMINITLVEGTARGAKDCTIDNVVSDYKKGHFIIELTCDITIKGKYKLEGQSQLIQNLFQGNSIHGDGSVKLKVEKLHLKLEYFFDFIRKEDGEIYIKCQKDKTVFEYEVGNARIAADKIFLGDQDASEVIVEYLNSNWKFVLNTFGKNFFDEAGKIVTRIIENFFSLTPTKYYISNDLSAYVKN